MHVHFSPHANHTNEREKKTAASICIRVKYRDIIHEEREKKDSEEAPTYTRTHFTKGETNERETFFLLLSSLSVGGVERDDETHPEFFSL